MLEIKAVKVSEWFGQAQALAREHWQETEAGFSDVPPDLDLSVYRALEDAGQAVAFAAFSDGLPVGYVSGFVVRHGHYPFLVGQHDLLFVSPAFRKGRLGLRLMAAFEAAAKEKGVGCVLYHAKPDSVFARLLQRQRARVEECVFLKEV
nr:MAG TPA: aminoglycoside-(3)-N-acetyltransferase [Caudoviricetes sp.]